METVQGIVLSCVKHSDRASVMPVYTLQRGVMSLVVPATGRARAGTKAVVRMPLALVEFGWKGEGGGETLCRPVGLTLRRAYTSLYFHPVKNALGIFLAEILTRLLREMPADAPLYAFLEGSLLYLDSCTYGLENYHIAFLSQLTGLLGIAPDVSGYTPQRIFDLRGARYAEHLPLHADILIPPRAEWPSLLSRLTFASMHRLRLSRSQRQELLTEILRYYAIHIPTIGQVKSIEVLGQVFS